MVAWAVVPCVPVGSGRRPGRPEEGQAARPCPRAGRTRCGTGVTGSRAGPSCLAGQRIWSHAIGPGGRTAPAAGPPIRIQTVHMRRLRMTNSCYRCGSAGTANAGPMQCLRGLAIRRFSLTDYGGVRMSERRQPDGLGPAGVPGADQRVEPGPAATCCGPAWTRRIVENAAPATGKLWYIKTRLVYSGAGLE